MAPPPGRWGVRSTKAHSPSKRSWRTTNSTGLPTSASTIGRTASRIAARTGEPCGGVVTWAAAHARVILGRVVDVGGAERRGETPFLIRRHRLVDAGDADVDPAALHLLGEEMRTVGRVGREVRRVEGGRGGDPLGECPERGQGTAAAEAVAETGDRPFDLRTAGKEAEVGLGVLPDRAHGRLAEHRHQLGALF